MGNICSCNFSNSENSEEFHGFNQNNKDINNNNNYYVIIKKQFHDYDEKDKKYYGKTQEYENIINNTSIQDVQVDNGPIEQDKGSVKIIHW